MPDFSFLELIVIAVVMFLVLGPEKTPEFFAQAARGYRKAMAWVTETRQSWKEELRELRDPVVQAREIVRGEIEEATGGVARELRQELADLRTMSPSMEVRPLSETYRAMREAAAKEPSPDTGSTQGGGFMQGLTPRQPSAPETPGGQEEPHAETLLAPEEAPNGIFASTPSHPGENLHPHPTDDAHGKPA